MVAVRDQWLATTHLGYTSLMRTLIAILTTLILFAAMPVAAGQCKRSYSDNEIAVKAAAKFGFPSVDMVSTPKDIDVAHWRGSRPKA